MNSNILAKNYTNLTPEERFRLILAAGARRDEAEQDRLTRAGQRLTLQMPDHAPYAHAFHEIATLIYIELLEDAAFCNEAWIRADDPREFPDDPGDDQEEEADEGSPEAEAKDAVAPAEDNHRKRPIWQRTLDVALATGYMLKIKADGWKLFCERLNLPPLLLWEEFPGFNRLQGALDMAEQAVFTPEGFLRWLNDVRPEGEPEHTEEVLWTVEEMADATEKVFRKRVAWWSG